MERHRLEEWLHTNRAPEAAPLVPLVSNARSPYAQYWLMHLEGRQQRRKRAASPRTAVHKPLRALLHLKCGAATAVKLVS
jgi:hypothetical protein